jgi:hypothetical protein
LLPKVVTWCVLGSSLVHDLRSRALVVLTACGRLTC